jgi:hypothetical protein
MIQLTEKDINRINQNLRRRDFIRLSALTFGTLAFSKYLPARATQRKKMLTGKSVIYICLDGGPSHLDTFDPKPKAGRDYCGPYRLPLSTVVPGLEICEKLPLLAKIADKYSIIRSMTHGYQGHETASYVTETGTIPSNNLIYPATGAVIAFKKESEYKNSIPPYMSVTTASTRFNEAGFLGPQYKSFATGGEPDRDNFSVEGIINSSVSDEKLNRRKDLLDLVDNFGLQFNQNPEFQKLDNFRDKAYSLILGEDRKVFNLKEETNTTRDRYGRNRLGQSCLLARRLAEKGVPFITVRNGGWDTHKQHFERMEEKLPELDKAVSALLADLAERGLLDQTIVICGGEFGRTPKVMWESPWNGGRGHFSNAFSYLVAGGGFIGGKVLGKTDNLGEKVIERPVYPWDLTASVYTLMGIDPNSKLVHPREGEIPILPGLGGKLSGGILTEIMK